MTSFLPYNNRNLDLSFLVFRPTVVLLDDLLEALKHFSFCTKDLGCAQSSIFKSIHGNMVIWYGAWTKRATENKDLLTATLLSLLRDTSRLAILEEQCFFDAFAGESKDGSTAAKFSTGDIISITIGTPTAGELNDLCYACLALFKSNFKTDGASSGVCLKCPGTKNTPPRVASLYVWKSLQLCYTWILNSDYRTKILPYLEKFSLGMKYDIFWVVYVSSDDLPSYQSRFDNHMVVTGGERTEEGQQEQLVQSEIAHWSSSWH
ncbi:hypothetical protein ACFE04_011597 [Oxalis oulophora]